tara:strand:+ start:2369 stop:3619 length:1251 start_codon:yes stop_codon:yes gene_type:complete
MSVRHLKHCIQMLVMYRRSICIWLTTVTFCSYVLFVNNCISPFQLQIEADLSLTKLEFAIISSSSYAFVYLFGQFYNGYLIQRYGFRAVMVFAVLSCICSNLLLACTNSFVWILLARLFAACGAVFAFITFILLVRLTFPQRYQGPFIGLGSLMSGLFASSAFYFTSVWTGSWHAFFLRMLFVCVVLLSLIVWHIPKGGEPAKLNGHHLRNMYRLLEDKYVLSLLVFCGSIYSGMQYLSSNEAFIFFQMKHFGVTEIKDFLTIAWIGYAVGCCVSGCLVGRIAKPDYILRDYVLLSFFCFVVIVYCNFNYVLNLLCFLMLGFSASGLIVALAFLNYALSEVEFLYVTSLVNLIVGLVSFVNPLVIGGMLDLMTTNMVADLTKYQISFIYLSFFIAMPLLVFKKYAVSFDDKLFLSR